ncbi:MAG: hypothetical protein ABIA78_01400 [archaeon]
MFDYHINHQFYQHNEGLKEFLDCPFGRCYQGMMHENGKRNIKSRDPTDFIIPQPFHYKFDSRRKLSTRRYEGGNTTLARELFGKRNKRKPVIEIQNKRQKKGITPQKYGSLFK